MNGAGLTQVIAEASLLGALPLTDLCQTGMDFADVPIPTKVPMAHVPGTERQYAEALFNNVTRLFDNYWDLLPQYAPYRQRYLALNAETLHEDFGTFLASITNPQNIGPNTTALMGRGPGVQPCVGC